MGRQQKYPVRLTEAEREQVRSITRAGKHSAQVLRRAQILLWSDEGRQDKEIIALLGCAPMTVSSTRERWVKEKRLEDQPRLGSKPILDAKQESLLIRELVDVHFPHAEKIRVVLDNLNTHSPASLYEAFPPEEARRLVRKLEFHHTPKHASWLNMAEIEFSVMVGHA